MAFLAENPLNESPLTFPLLECIHIIGFAFSVGTIALVDLRLLGVAMLRQTPAELLKDTRLWTLAGIATMILSGLMLFSSDPDMYYLNASFVFKMICLALAIVFNYTIHRKVASTKSPPRKAKVVACVSLALWGAVVFGGIFIAFVNQGF
ncbi:MAG TPA: DUF6644 family protein [Bryobacteraceae bacterium]|nr:DUF6644 family protein [Bryobacteraceae bacterium]